jgi:glycosyltransferase involved in cell wall biosynthesis
VNILHAAKTYYHTIGGTERYLRNLCDELDRAGHRTVFLYAHQTTPEGLRPEYLLPSYADFPPIVAADWKPGLAAILHRESIDLVHLHGVWNPEVISWLGERVPVVRSDHEHGLHCPAGSKYFRTTGGICTHPYGPRCLWDALLKGCNSRRLPRLWSTYQRIAAMRAVEPCISHFIVASKFVRDWLVKNGYSAQKINVLPYFTEFANQRTSPPNANEDSPKIVLFVGRIVRQKGWREFLLILRELKHPFRAIVNGDGPDLPAMKRLCVRCGILDKVTFLGWSSTAELIECYRQSSIVVVPSVWPEPFGIVGIEAMSFGKPVVAFRVGGIPEWLEDGITGYLVEPRNVKGMAEKINLLLERPELAREMGSAGKRWVENSFNRKNHIVKMVEIYHGVTAARSGATGSTSA